MAVVPRDQTSLLWLTLPLNDPEKNFKLLFVFFIYFSTKNREVACHFGSKQEEKRIDDSSKKMSLFCFGIGFFFSFFLFEERKKYILFFVYLKAILFLCMCVCDQEKKLKKKIKRPKSASLTLPSSVSIIFSPFTLLTRGEGVESMVLNQAKIHLCFFSLISKTNTQRYTHVKCLFIQNPTQLYASSISGL